MTVLGNGEQHTVQVNGQRWAVTWHLPAAAPEGKAHGAEGICLTGDSQLVLVSRDGASWEFPAGRTEPGESWEQTLRREVREEACATVVRARLLGFCRGECVAGPEEGLVLVRSIWRAAVELSPWTPEHEITHRRVAPPGHVKELVGFERHPFAPVIGRALHEADIG
ncbi:MAG: NUDIX hydrolase [Micromonosporaceae bacterium]